LPILHRALTGSPPRKQIWSLGISPLTNNAATSAESGLDQKSTFRNVRFWRKADIFTDIHLSPMGDIGFCGIALARRKRSAANIALCAEADMPLSDAAGKKEEPPSSHPYGSEGSLAGGAKWCTAVTLFAAIPRQDESGSNERM